MESDGDWAVANLGEIEDEVTVGLVGPMTAAYVEIGVPFLRSQNVDPFSINCVAPEMHQQRVPRADQQIAPVSGQRRHCANGKARRRLRRKQEINQHLDVATIGRAGSVHVGGAAIIRRRPTRV